MMRWVALAVVATAVLSSAAAAGPVTVKIVRGARPPAAAWNLTDPATPEETRAAGIVTEALTKRDFPERVKQLGQAAQALERTLAAQSPTLDGGVLVVLAPEEPAAGLCPEVGCAPLTDGTNAKLYALLGAGGVDAQQDGAAGALVRALDDAIPELEHLVREAAFAAAYRPRVKDAAWWNEHAGDGSLFASGDAQQALSDGATAAAEVANFKAAMTHALGDAHVEGGAGAGYRKLLPPGNRAIVRLAELAGASDAAELAGGPAVREAYGMDWSDPAFERAASDAPAALRTPDAMQGCPAFVATVLADLYGGGLIGRAQVKKLAQQGGLALVLDRVAAHASKEVVDQLLARRAHGANFDEAEAAANVEALRRRKQSAEAFAARHRKLIAAHAKDAPPVVVGDDLGQLPLTVIPCHGPAAVAARIRALAASDASPEDLGDVMRLVSAGFVGLASRKAFGDEPVEAPPEAPEEALHYVVENGVKKGLELVGDQTLEAGIEMLSAKLEKTAAHGVLESLSLKIGLKVGMPIFVDAVVHQVINHNWSFTNCPLTEEVRRSLILRTLLDVSHWTVGAAAKIVINAGAGLLAAEGVALVFEVSVPVAGWIVLAGVCVVEVFKIVVTPALERAHHRNMTRQLAFEIGSYVSPQGPDGGRPAQLASWGTLGQAATGQYDCAEAAKGQLVMQTVFGFQGGELKEWTDFQDAELASKVNDLNSAMKDRRDAVDGAQVALAAAADPLVHVAGFWDALKYQTFGSLPSPFNDVEDVLPFLAFDGHGLECGAREIADHLTLMHVTALLSGDQARTTLDQYSDDELAGLQAGYEKQAAEILARTGREELRARHLEAQRKYRDAVATAKDHLQDKKNDLLDWLEHDAFDRVNEIAQTAEQQRDEVDQLHLERLDGFDQAQSMVRYLQDHRQARAKLAEGCRRLTRP